LLGILTGMTVLSLASGFASNGFQRPSSRRICLRGDQHPVYLRDFHQRRGFIRGAGIAASTAPLNVPEPWSLALLGSDLFGLGMIRRRKPNLVDYPLSKLSKGRWSNLGPSLWGQGDSDGQPCRAESPSVRTRLWRPTTSATFNSPACMTVPTRGQRMRRQLIVEQSACIIDPRSKCPVHRRNLFPLAAGLAVAASFPAKAQGPATTQQGTAFTSATVRNIAQEMSGKPFQAPERGLPAGLENLDYSAYQTLRFNPDQALWRGTDSKFTAQFFHRGYLFRDKVEIFEVADGHATEIRYGHDLFRSDKVQVPAQDDLGFAGFRLHYPLNKADYNDEVCAFLGASYFRAVARGQGYGLSARGLAIKTADPAGEEFPLFKRFWLERPMKGSDVMVIHALLDSPSTTGAFRFTLRPGAETVMDTEVALYPRVDITTVGIAPMTSMFLFDSNNRTGFDDYRLAVHDSHALELLTSQGQRVWRPLNNPRILQVSAFQDPSPRGFGMAQRERDFQDYQDLEAVYEKRPSLWAEPIGDWGQGAVTLVEIPSDREVNDNMVAFWRPRDKLAAKGEYFLSYRLHWCWQATADPGLAQVTQTRCGLSFDHKDRQFVIDFAGGALKGRGDDARPDIDIGSDKGKIANVTLQKIPGGEAWRLSFQLVTGDEKVVEMHVRLLDAGKPVSETWVYRWTS
jgi:glucans biosynthesis protein